MSLPTRQIRAVFDNQTIRVYQDYPDAIAETALAHGTFVSPPFKMERMTWIKPSFLWMMYRSGWGLKDAGQARILAVDRSRKGFEWALAHSCPSHSDDSMSQEKWRREKEIAPVRALGLSRQFFARLASMARPRSFNSWSKFVPSSTIQNLSDAGSQARISSSLSSDNRIAIPHIRFDF